MAEIRSPLTDAMKTRAQNALQELGYDVERLYTPRKLRAFILHVDDSDLIRAAMTSEGWFEPAGEVWQLSSNTPVSLS